MKKLEKLFLVLMIFIIVEGLFCFTGCTKTEEEVLNETMEVTKAYLDNPTEENYKKLMKQKEKLEKFMAKKQKEEATDESNLEKEPIEDSKPEEKIPQTYEEWLAKAKEYESQKRWCSALGAYYDAMGIDIPPENKTEAYNGFVALESAILKGNPGFGTFNEFTLHDEWKNLLADADEYTKEIFPYEITIGELVRGDLDYTTQTASYSAILSYRLSNRYNNIIEILGSGYKRAYKSDWTDLPQNWPKRVGAYKCTFNISDENGKELVAPVTWFIGSNNKITFTGIKPEVMDLIDNNKAFVKPVTIICDYYLQMQTPVFISSFNKQDKIHELVTKTMEKNFDIDFNMIKIPNKPYEMLKTEVTQLFYKSFMGGENPSKFKGLQNPIESVSWYDAIYFCNKLSETKGYEPVYSVNGNTKINEWNYIPHNGDSIYSGDINQNLSANGYRLPTVEEWQYAAKGGQDNTTYAGSNNVNEVAWFNGNSNKTTHPVAQKKANGYGLYDMSGNVWEWCWEPHEWYSSQRSDRGGCWSNNEDVCTISCKGTYDAYEQSEYIGFRIIRSVK